MLTPFEAPDQKLFEASTRAGATPVLHLGHNLARAQELLNNFSTTKESFSICLSGGLCEQLQIPDQVDRIILPWGSKAPQAKKAQIVWQARTQDEVLEAIASKAKTLILKGSESAGLCKDDSAFLLFQKTISACKNANVEVYIQGGIGVNTASAYLALGATGVILDSQLALFPECSLSQELKDFIGRLNGNEIKSLDGYHYYIPLGAKDPGSISGLEELSEHIAAADSVILPLGQDVILASDLVNKYKNLKGLVRAITRSAATNLKHAQRTDAFAFDGRSAGALGTSYPIVQGPMARISDVPAFLQSVSLGGALPVFAMGMMTDDAREVLTQTAELMNDRPWGVGIFGFGYPKTIIEQTEIILEINPTHVLIAGARPGQELPFIEAGIHVLAHAPTPGAFDMLAKEGMTSFIFEGRESGGHVGSLYSSILWEKQINKVLELDNPSQVSILFAGGIHDALSAAFVRVMAGPLAARGVKTGLQVGTAYLYTEEAVNDGAITEIYQQTIIDENKTLLLKSGSGQESRCAPSAFSDFFMEEKSRMEQEGLSSGDVMQKLEALNLGRLRIAAKGINRVDGELVSLSESQQLEQGLYMTGTVSEIMQETTTIAALHESLTLKSYDALGKETSAEDLTKLTEHDSSTSQFNESDIAIVGMSGLFPEAESIEEFWRNVLFANDCITEVSRDRWSIDTFFNPDTRDSDSVVSKWGGFIGKSDFDALEFGITPQSLSSIEPIQILSLLVAKRALQDAGIDDPVTADLEETAVFFGAVGAGGSLSEAYQARVVLKEVFGAVPEEIDAYLPRTTEDSFAGVLGNVISGRISNRLNTGGSNYTVDAACASSLATLDLAVSELRSKKANMVVMGGADLHNGIGQFLMFNSTYALSPKGRCATFDTEADGIALAECVAVVILKRLEDAERDGNKIYAVIKGVGASSDGKNLGLTAPSKRGQVLALERAYEDAGVTPSDVGLIEPHGTGTVAGDRVELQALSQLLWDDGAEASQVSLSSLKSVMGHAKCAAGIAGLIKATLCVQHGIFPATLHLQDPNKFYTSESPFNFRTQKAGYWQEERRVAGVSAFGFGGTNFHAVIQNYEAAKPKTTLKAWPSELFVFSGETAEEAHALMDKVQEMLAVNDKLRIIDIAYSLATQACDKTIQYALVAGTRDELLERMSRAQEGAQDDSIYGLNPVDGKLAFLFPGQGSQRIHMAADLFLVFPHMRKLLNEYPEYERILFPPSVFLLEEQKAQRVEITDTRNAQPLLGIVDLAIAELLDGFGIKPDVVAGHSYGELPALCFAGAFDAAQLVALSRVRAESILAAVKEDQGRMAAVFTDRETLTQLVEGMDEIWPVNYNAPRQTVVAGSKRGMDAFLKKAEDADVPCKELQVACAFHSPLLAGADKGFSAAMEHFEFCEPRLEVMSNTSAKLYPDTVAAIKERLAEHLVEAVNFTEEIEFMHSQGVSVFLEVGPGNTLTELTSLILKDKDITLIHTEQSGANGLTLLLQSLAQYIATGRKINMDKLFEGRDAEQLPIDNPEANKKEGLIWTIDGSGSMPKDDNDAARPAEYREFLRSWGRGLLENSGQAGLSPEHIMMSYLDNMNAMVQDQRDVMLGYLGNPEVAPRAQVARRQILISSTADAEGPRELEAPGEEGMDNEGSDLIDIQSLSTEEITELIFEIVSEKTGYPTSMLSLETDLEADLSIDSIKKMEIIGGLRNRVVLPKNEDGMEAVFEKLISVRTFNDLVLWVEDLGRFTAEGGAAVEAEEVSVQAVIDLDGNPGAEEGDLQPPVMTRMTYEDQQSPIEEVDVSLIENKNFAILDDGAGLAASLAELLQEKGAKAQLVSSEEAGSVPELDGLVIINAMTGARRYTQLELFRLLKTVDLDNLKWLTLFDDTMGTLLAADDLKETLLAEGLPEGFPGFLKSLSHEYEHLRCCVAQFEIAFDPKSFASIAADELSNTKHLPEIFFGQEGRFIRIPKARTLNMDLSAINVALEEDSVVVVLGGAQGITPHMLKRMAKDLPCQYVLVGRTAHNPEYDEFAACQTVDEIRKVLIERESELKPKEIEAKAKAISKSNQIVSAIAGIEEAGAKAFYKNVDVCNEQAFGELLEAIKTEYGSIDGVIHAAGVLEDKLFSSKEEDSFVRVYHTKVSPLKTVVERLVPDIKLLVLFSSAASSFGNAGQSDYAAGNSVLDNTARALSNGYPELKAVVFSWAPWEGAGMVGDTLKAEFEKRGVGLIDLEEGCEFFAQELVYGSDVSVLCLVANEQVILDYTRKYGYA